MSQRTPRELIELYWNEVWNNRNADMIRELCADPILRHDPGSVTALSIEDQVARVRQQSETAEPYFEHEVLLADDEYVTSVWNMHTRKGDRVDLCGIEVFKAENGKFTHCWNSPYVAGRWGREGDQSVPDNLPPPEFIASPDQITKDWLQQVFQAAGLDAPRVSIVSSEPIGHGNMSNTIRTQIVYNANAENAINSVICKLTSNIPQAQEIAKAHGVNRREVETYRALGEAPVLNMPRAWFAETSADGAGVNLVLEDLSERTRSGDQITGCSPADAKAVVSEFAKLHAHYWGNDALADAPWLYNRKSQTEEIDAGYAAAAEIFRTRFSDRLDERYLACIDRFVGKAGEWTRDNIQARTLIHGEARVDNVLFEDLEDGVKAWLIDWQFTDFGSPMFDTAYFLGGSLQPADREACEADLIALQQSSIARIDPSYTLEIARREYARSLPFALFTTVGSALAVPEGEHTDKLLMTLLMRNVDALDHWTE